MPPRNSELRRLVEARAGRCCEYCRSQLRYATQPFSLEHIVPLARGGSSDAGNLALACQGCNNHKFTKVTGLDAASGATVPLYHPRRDRWRDHFAWNHDATLVLGLTPSGRATVEALQLNRAGLVTLRKVLYAAGVHPPPDVNAP